MPDTLIIGGGISGLATAYYLRQRWPNHEILILEAAARVGGSIGTHRQDGFQVELGANGFPDNKPSTLGLCEKLGLQGELIPASPAARHRYLFHNGRLRRLPEGLWSFLFSPLLGWRSKLAILTEGRRTPRLDAADESVHDFIARRTTAEVAEVLGDALVTGIYAGDPRLLSAPAAFPRVVEWEREHGGVLAGMKAAARKRAAEDRARGKPVRRGSRLWSFRAGLGQLIEKLAEVLSDRIQTSVRVTRLSFHPSADPHAARTWTVHGELGRTWQCRDVILACPAHVQANLVADLDPELAVEMQAIPYAPAVVVGVGYRETDVPTSLNGFGVITPQRLRRDILGVQWCSSIFPDRAPPGMVLLRAIAGGWHQRDIVDWDDERLLAAVRNELRAAMRIDAAPVFYHIVRWPKAIPQYHLGHRDRVARIEQLASRFPGLILTGNAYRGVAVNDCTEQAEAIVEKMEAYYEQLR